MKIIKKEKINWEALFLIGVLALLIWINQKQPPKIVFEVNNDWIEKIAYEREQWGYANGLAMPTRIIAEQNYFSDLPKQSCEEVIGEMYEMAMEMYPRVNPK